MSWNESGNHMCDSKGPYERFEGPHCPKCKSHMIYDTRQCPVCLEETERLHCPKDNEKTIPVMVCHECLHSWEE